MITPQNLVRHELIGLKAKISDSSDREIIGIQGKVVDESRNSLALEVKGKEKLQEVFDLIQDVARFRQERPGLSRALTDQACRSFFVVM